MTAAVPVRRAASSRLQEDTGAARGLPSPECGARKSQSADSAHDFISYQLGDGLPGTQEEVRLMKSRCQLILFKHIT